MSEKQRKAQTAQERTEELLRMEGVMAKGFGCVAKYAMHDQSISATAKGLYAYLCSLSGGGTITYPRRDNILIALKLSKTTYYKALSSLIEVGYITVHRTLMRGDHWKRNVYTIMSNPKCYHERTQEQNEDSPNTLRFRGMLSSGYGMIPRLVMQDQRLTIKEKALYAYLLCYADAGTSAFPKVETVKAHLGIGTSSFQKYMNTLQRLGYIVKEQRRECGRFGVVDYFICTQTEPQALPPLEKQDTEKQDATVQSPPSVENWDTEKQDNFGDSDAPSLEKWDTEKWDDFAPNAPLVEKWDTRKSDVEKSDIDFSDTKSTPTSNNTHTQSIFCEEENPHPHKQNRKTEARFDPQEIRATLLSERGLSSLYLDDTRSMTYALRVCCDYFEAFPWTTDPEEQSIYDTVFDALCQLCTRSKSKVRAKFLSNSEVVELLNARCMDMLLHRPDLTALFEYLVEVYRSVLEDRKLTNPNEPIKYPVAYAKSVIWDALQIYKRESDSLY